jgi:hypothetical protein
MIELLIKLRYQCYIHACSGKYMENILLLFIISFSYFCVKRPDGDLVLPDGDSGCPDNTVDSSRHYWSLSGRPCFCDLLRGTTSGRHLCSVWTMIKSHSPYAAHHFLLSFCDFLLFCAFSL